jgi:hypothetical protein
VEVWLLLIVVLLFLWLIVSSIVFIYWWVNPRSRDKFMSSHEKIGVSFYIGAFLSCAFVVSGSLRALLVFIPDSWGGYGEDGEFIRTRDSIAYSVGTVITVGLACIYRDMPKIKILARKEVQAALGILEEADPHRLDGGAFRIIREEIEGLILSHRAEFVAFVQKGNSIRAWVYTNIANTAGDFLESGQYHVYRGVLNSIGPGEDLLRLFDAAVDELVHMGCLDGESAEMQKDALRENIKSVG